MAKIISSLPGSTSVLSRTSQLINDGSDNTSAYVETDELGTTAFSNNYNDLNNLPIIGDGITNLAYTTSPTQGIVTSDTGSDAIIPLADDTNAGLLEPSKYTILENTSGTNTGDQDLQSVLEKGNTTTEPFYNEFDAGSGNYARSGVISILGAPFPIVGQSTNNSGQLTEMAIAPHANGGFIVYKTGIVNKKINFLLPDKTNILYPSPNSYTLATLDDIPTPIDISGKVPYTGATTDVDLGEFQLKTGQLELDQTPTGTFSTAKIRWNDTAGTAEIRLKGNGVTLQLGQELVKRVVNKTATNITLQEANYQVVRIIGATGQRLSVDLAQADSEANSASTLGLVTENIANNQEGFITFSGEINLINTTGSLQGETWVDGDVLYLSPTVAGGLTNVAPTAPDHTVRIGYVQYTHAIQGKIHVDVDRGYSLENLHNVKITATTAGKILGSTTEGLWENKTIPDALGFTPENVANKSDSYATSSSTTYASTKALVDGLGVTQKDVVYVDTNGSDVTGVLGNIRKPFLTINAALDALPSTGGVVKIGIGTFNSPLLSKVKSNTYFIGSGKPTTNSIYTYTAAGGQPTITAPSKLVGGTILNGKFDLSLRDNIGVFTLGVDVGSDWCTAFNAGVAEEGLIFAQKYTPEGGESALDGVHPLQSDSRPRTGIVVRDVSSLCKTSNSPVHAMLIENTINASISNVSTYYGGAGLVIKSIGCKVDGFDGHGHQAGLIIKSNDYAHGASNNINNVYISSIIGYDGGGISLVGLTGATLFETNINNAVLEHLDHGIDYDGSVEVVSISNTVIRDTHYEGIGLGSGVANLKLTNIEQRNGFNGISLVGVKNASISNISTSNNTYYGIYLDSPLYAVYIINSYSSSNPLGVYLNGNVYGSVFDSNDNITGSIVHRTVSTGNNLAAIDSNGRITKAIPIVDAAGNMFIEGSVSLGGAPPVAKFNLKEIDTSLEVNTDTDGVSMLSFNRTSSEFKDFKIRSKNFTFTPFDVEKARITENGAASFALSVTSPTFIGSLTGHASLDLPLTGGTLTGQLNVIKTGAAAIELQGGTGYGEGSYIAFKDSGSYKGILGLQGVVEGGVYSNDLALQSYSNNLFLNAGDGKAIVSKINSVEISRVNSGGIEAINYTGSATLTGTPTAPTAPVGTTGNQISTLDFGIANFVGLTGNQTIDGSKTFNNIVSSIGASIDNGGSNTGVAVINNGSATGISINSDSTGRSLVLNNYTGATGMPLTISKNNVDKFTVTDGGLVTTGVYTVATLPTPTGTAYATVSDALAPTYLGTLTGGGTVVCPVFYNGTAWVAH